LLEGSRPPRAFVAVAPPAFLLSAVTVALALTADRGDHDARVLLELVVAAGFLGVGLYVLARGRTSWFGLLAVAVGAGLCLECWRFTDRALPYTIGLLFGSLWSSPLFHLALAFPTGGLRPAERRFMTLSYAYVLLLLPLPFLFWEGPYEPACDPCPENLAAIWPDRDVAGPCWPCSTGSVRSRSWGSRSTSCAATARRARTSARC
jgi:hypothetical protein